MNVQFLGQVNGLTPAFLPIITVALASNVPNSTPTPSNLHKASNSSTRSRRITQLRPLHLSLGCSGVM